MDYVKIAKEVMKLEVSDPEIRNIVYGICKLGRRGYELSIPRKTLLLRTFLVSRQVRCLDLKAFEELEFLTEELLKQEPLPEKVGPKTSTVVGQLQTFLSDKTEVRRSEAEEWTGPISPQLLGRAMTESGWTSKKPDGWKTFPGVYVKRR